MNRGMGKVHKSTSYYVRLALKLVPRLATSPLRLLPGFLVIGAAKCGTTYLYCGLGRHPSIAPALRKEVYFYDRTFRRGLAWYRAFFPTVLERFHARQILEKPLITGEATPSYLFHPHAPKRVFETIPGVKLIALLRNPVDRAYSFYHQQFRRGIETLSFEEAVEREEERLSGELDKMLSDGGYFSFNRQNYSYLARGIYVDQLKNWTGLFPKEQLLVLSSERLFENPYDSFKRVHQFLGLPGWEPNGYEKRHVGAYCPMDAETRERLVEHFRPHNRRLYDFLGADLDWDR